MSLARRGRRHPGIDRSDDAKQSIEYFVADARVMGLHDAIAGTHLAAASEGHGKADQVLLSIREYVGRVSCLEELDYGLIVIRHGSTLHFLHRWDS